MLFSYTIFLASVRVLLHYLFYICVFLISLSGKATGLMQRCLFFWASSSSSSLPGGPSLPPLAVKTQVSTRAPLGCLIRAPFGGFKTC